MTVDIPLIRSSYLKLATETLAQFNAPVEAILAQNNVPWWHDAGTDCFMPTSHLYRVAAAGVRATGCRTFGLEMGKALAVKQFGTTGRQICQAPTVYGAMQRFRRLLRADQTGRRLKIIEGPDEIWLCRDDCGVHFGPGGSGGSGEAAMEQLALMMMVRVVRLGAGPRWRPDAVMVKHNSAADLKQNGHFGNASIWSGDHLAGIAVPRSIAVLPTAPCRGMATGLVKRDPPAADFLGAIRQVVTSLLAVAPPEIHIVAEISGLHPRTLQRRLKQLGTHYKDVLDQARFELATHMLTDTDVSITEIALDLGYTESAHLTRAFRRWVGICPRDYRRRHPADTGGRPVGLVPA